MIRRGYYQKFLEHQENFSHKYQPKDKRILLSLNQKKSVGITIIENSFFRNGKFQIKYKTYEFDNTVVVLNTSRRKITKKVAKKFEKKLDKFNHRKKCYIDYTYVPEHFLGRTTFVDFLVNISVFLDTYKDTIPANTKRLYNCPWCFNVFVKCNPTCQCACPCDPDSNDEDEETDRDFKEEE